LASSLTILTLILLQAGGGPLEDGQRAFREKDWARAERAFLQAAQADPNKPLAHRWLGMTYAAQEKYALAERPFRRACQLSSRDEACYYLGRTLTTLSRFQEAISVYEKAGANKAAEEKWLLGMAVALEGAERFDEAQQRFRQAIAAGSKQAEIDYAKFRRKRSAPRLVAPAIRFEAADLPVTVRTGASGRKYLPETMLAGVAVFDADGDHWPDIFIANGAALPSLRKPDASFHDALLHNNHDGTFSNVTAKAGLQGEGYSMGVAAADYDNDGDADLFVAGVNRSALYRNRGDGTFENITAASGLSESGLWNVSAAWLDFDNDGLLDLFVVRYVQWDSAREPYCGTPEHRQYCHPRFYKPLANALYRNRGDGTFEDVSEASSISGHEGKGMGIAVGDYDNDGRIDVFVANDTLPNFLFQNGGGKFRETATEAGVAFNESGTALSSMGAEMHDVDNDGREDLFITALSNETFPLFRNLPAGFSDSTLAAGIAAASLPWTGWGTAAIDLDDDGWKDLVTANGHVMDNAEAVSGRKSRQPVQVYLNRALNTGQRVWAAAQLPGEALHRGLAYGDFDRDGRQDLVITRLNEHARLWWNRYEPNNWIALRLRGVQSNRDGIGALVQVDTAPGSQWKRMVSSNGYGGSSLGPVHFGLGKESRAKNIVIRWPSGIVQSLDNLESGHIYDLTEGVSVAVPEVLR